MSKIPQEEINAMLAAIDAADDPDTGKMSREEAVYCLQTYISDEVSCDDCKYHKLCDCRRKEAHHMAIDALRQPPDDNWKTYSDRLWKAAYERGKADAMRKGEWIENGTGVFVTCNRCGRRNIKENFCPSCGADMRGEENVLND